MSCYAAATNTSYNISFILITYHNDLSNHLAWISAISYVCVLPISKRPEEVAEIQASTYMYPQIRELQLFLVTTSWEDINVWLEILIL